MRELRKNLNLILNLKPVFFALNYILLLFSDQFSDSVLILLSNVINKTFEYIFSDLEEREEMSEGNSIF